MTRESFELPIEIRPEDIDELGHVNNVVYVRWVQDAAVAHWRSLASAADQAAVAWVVVRHEIDYRRAVGKGDAVVARTWVGRARRATFERFTEIVRRGNGEILAKARTLWCPIDAETGKHTRVSHEVRERFSTS